MVDRPLFMERPKRPEERCLILTAMGACAAEDGRMSGVKR